MLNTVLITGANRGIGLALTTNYLESGCTVFACCRNPDQAEQLHTLKKKHEEHLNILCLDVTDQQSLQQLPKNTKHQAIDLLINNAGIFGPRTAKLADLTLNDFTEVFAVNTFAPLQVTLTLLPQLQKSQAPVVINMSSQMGSIGDNHQGGAAPYRVSKAALNMLTRNFALDVENDNIAVAVIHPGWVQTDMGGERAPLSVEESALKIKSVIDRISKERQWGFYSYDGSQLPW